jgi:hypothetical protein
MTRADFGMTDMEKFQFPKLEIDGERQHGYWIT